MKSLIFSLFNLLGINALFRRLHRGQIKVLLYHNIVPNREHFSNAISPEEFSDQLLWLKSACNVVQLNQDGNWIGLSDDKVNVLITFDDGFSNNFEYAFPILLRHNLSAVFFLIANCIKTGAAPHFANMDNKPTETIAAHQTLTISHAKQLIDAGMTIGSHSMDHIDHRQFDDSHLKGDAIAAQQLLSNDLGVPISAFAYPWGYHHPEQTFILASYYRRIFLTRHGFCHSYDYSLPRNEVANLGHLQAAVSGALDFFSRI